MEKGPQESKTEVKLEPTGGWMVRLSLLMW